MSAVLLPNADQGEPRELTMRRRSRAAGRARRWDTGPAATGAHHRPARREQEGPRKDGPGAHHRPEATHLGRTP